MVWPSPRYGQTRARARRWTVVARPVTGRSWPPADDPMVHLAPCRSTSSSATPARRPSRSWSATATSRAAPGARRPTSRASSRSSPSTRRRRTSAAAGRARAARPAPVHPVPPATDDTAARFAALRPRSTAARGCELHLTRTRAVFGDGDPARRPHVRRRGAGLPRRPAGQAVRRPGRQAPRTAAGDDRPHPAAGLHRQRPQVAAAQQPRPAPRRDRRLRALPHASDRAHRAARHLHAGQLRHQAALGRARPASPACTACRSASCSGGRTVYLFPIFHPAAALYTPAMLATLKQDILRLPEVLALPLDDARRGGRRREQRRGRRRRAVRRATRAGCRRAAAAAHRPTPPTALRSVPSSSVCSRRMVTATLSSPETTARFARLLAGLAAAAGRRHARRATSAPARRPSCAACCAALGVRRRSDQPVVHPRPELSRSRRTRPPSPRPLPARPGRRRRALRLGRLPGRRRPRVRRVARGRSGELPPADVRRRAGARHADQSRRAAVREPRPPGRARRRAARRRGRRRAPRSARRDGGDRRRQRLRDRRRPRWTGP